MEISKQIVASKVTNPSKVVQSPAKKMTTSEMALVNKKEELGVAQSVGLIKQVKIVELEIQELEAKIKLDAQKLEIKTKGYQVTTISDLMKRLKVHDHDNLLVEKVSDFDKKLPLGMLCKFKELKENRLFNRLYVVSPCEKPDPLFIGERFLIPADKVCNNIMDREKNNQSVIVLLSQWE